MRAGRIAAAAAGIDDEHRADVVPDVLDVVRDRGIPGQIVARTELLDMVALRHAPAPPDDEMVLIALMGVDARREPRRCGDLEDADVPGCAGIDLAEDR